MLRTSPRWPTALAIAIIAALSIWIRWPGFTQGGFANHDVAGILYEGMLLHAGELPYVASVELKAPGTFYLASWLAGPRATDIARFQIWANAWGIFSLLALSVLAWRLWGGRAAIVTACFYILLDAHLDTMDANYVTWAQLPGIAAVAWAFAGLARRQAQTALVWIVAGIACGLAALLKQPTGLTAALTVIAIAAWPTAVDADGSARPPRVRVRAVAFALLGMIVAHVPIAIHYASHDELPALLRGYLLSRRGLDYVTFGTLNLADDALSEGVSALIFFLALPLAIAAFTAWPPRSRRDRAITLLAITWAAFAILGASIGFRFYKGYFLAALPPLCLLAAAPWGLSGTARGLRRWQRAALFVPIAFGVARQIVVLDHERDNRAVAHDLGGRKIADHVRANTTANDRIWIWGWHLWDVYSLADRLSGSRLYKSMNIITTDDDGNWRRARSPMKFVDGPAARRLLADLERSRPAYIVLGSTVPHREFAALGRFLRTHYRRDRRVRVGRVEFWQRRLSEGP